MRPSRWLPERLHWRLFAARLAADPASYRRFVTSTRLPEGEHVEVGLRPLRGPATIRARSADMYTVLDLLPPVHLPPPEVGEVRRVWDLGANIGLTMAHIAAVHPQAHITGVELDAENAELARRNVARFGDRCRIVEGAVWAEEGEIGYQREQTEVAAFRVTEDPADQHATATAVTLNRLLADQPDGEPVDYVKMDIEGAEQHVLRENVEWAERVRSIRVEVHAPYTVDGCMDDLRRLGFEASTDPSVYVEGGGLPVQGVRRS